MVLSIIPPRFTTGGANNTKVLLYGVIWVVFLPMMTLVKH